MTTNRIAFLLIVCYQVLIWLVVRNDPFFGDAISSTAQAATHIYKQQLATIFYPVSADPGHPTFYSYLLAFLWKTTSYSLPVAHAYSCVWAAFLLWAVYVFAKQFLPNTSALVALIGCMLFATMLSQSAMVLNTLALMVFFINAVIGVMTRNVIRFVLSASLMSITHLQAPFLLLSLCFFDWYRSVVELKQLSFWKWVRFRFAHYFIPIVCWFGWLYTHYLHTGWFLHSPHYSDADSLNGPLEWFRAMVTIIARLLDYGMIACYAILLYAAIKYPFIRKRFVSWILLLAPLCVTMAIFLSNTIGHRYFLAFQLLAIVATVAIIERIFVRKRTTYLVVGICLLLGNILYYPGKILGDATLAYRDYFALETKLLEAYPNHTFYSHAPIANPTELTQLRKNGSARFIRLNNAAFDTIPAIVQSNINAEFTEREKQWLEQNWYGQSFESGAVYVTVFLNPRYYPSTPIKQFRKPSSIEQAIIKLKKIWKSM